MTGTLIGREGRKAQPIIRAGFVRKETNLKLHKVADVKSAEFGVCAAAGVIVGRVDEIHPRSAE